jgi:hypothetical protein
MKAVALTGKEGGDVALLADFNITIPSNSTQRIQELHFHVLHTICSLIESNLFTCKQENERRVSKVETRRSDVREFHVPVHMELNGNHVMENE